jgi:hypothetical protein
MNDNEITDIVILTKNLNHNERMALFEYIRKINEKARKETLKEVGEMIDKVLDNRLNWNKLLKLELKSLEEKNENI